MSSKWINSLFNSDTSRLTPLDFRLTAAAQFRLLKAMCSSITEGVDYMQETFLGSTVDTSKIMSRVSLNAEMDVAIAQFIEMVRTGVISNRGVQFVMMIIRLARINSAVHTDAFHFGVPGSDHYEAISTFYPLYDNATYNNVSYLNILSFR